MTSTIASHQRIPLDAARSRRVGIVCLVATELALFTIFVVAYLFYIGKSLTGPTPAQVLELPIWPSICLLSSSLTVTVASRALAFDKIPTFRLWTGLTVLLGLEFSTAGQAIEWRHLIVDCHLTLTTNLFGTTFYSLVGLHASHVVLGLSLLALTLGLGGRMQGHARRFELGFGPGIGIS